MKSPPIDCDTVREMLRTATPDRVLRFIGKSHPADIALLFKGLDPAEVRQLFDVLFSSRCAAKTLKELPLELLPNILALIDDEKVGRLIVRADPDDTLTFIDSLPGDRRERVLVLLDPVSRAAVREIINYLDGTVRRLKTTHFMALPPATTAQSAIALGELEFSSAWRAIVKQVSVNICIAIAAGAVIPLLLKALKLDPAPGSGVIVSGLTDAFGFLSFLGLATVFRSYLI